MGWVDYMCVVLKMVEFFSAESLTIKFFISLGSAPVKVLSEDIIQYN